MIRSRALITALTFAMLAAIAPAAHAIPALQLYSPDAVYDQNSETWVLTEGTFELWVVGNTGQFGDILDVDLAGSFYGSSGSITVTLVSDGSTVATDSDPSNGGTNAYDQIVNHDEFKSADGHIFWTLGDLSGDPDAIMDYQPGSETDTGTGKILKLMVSISGYESVHFDAFDHYVTENGAGYKTHYKFAPFSHDATGGGGGGGGGGSAPEPGSLWMLGAGLAGLVATSRRKRNR